MNCEIDEEVIELCNNKTLKDIKKMMNSSTLFDIERAEKLFDLRDTFNEIFDEAHAALMNFVFDELEIKGKTLTHINAIILEELSRNYKMKLNELVQTFAFNFEMDYC